MAAMISAVLVNFWVFMYSFSNSCGAAFISFGSYLVWMLFPFLIEPKFFILLQPVVHTQFYGAFSTDIDKIIFSFENGSFNIL